MSQPQLRFPESNDELSAQMRAQAHWIRGIAQQLLKDDNLVDEVVQQTFVAWLRKPPREGRIRGWLRTVVTNFVRMQAREQKRRRAREERVARQEAAVPTEAATEVAELREQLSAAVLDLEEPYRSTILDIYFKERSAQELAQELGVPANTVLVRRKRALQKLRERLQRLDENRDWRLGILLLYAVNFPADFVDVSTDDPLDDDPSDDDSDDDSDNDPADDKPDSDGADSLPGEPEPLSKSSEALHSGAPTLHSFELLRRDLEGVECLQEPGVVSSVRRRGLAIAAFVLPLLLVSGGYWLHRSGAGERDGVVAEGGAVASSEKSSSNDSVSPTSQLSGASAGTAESPDSELTRATPDTIVVRVIDALTGDPIADAALQLGDFDMGSGRVGHGRDLYEFLTLPFGDAMGVTSASGEIEVLAEELRTSRLSVRARGYEEYREGYRARWGLEYSLQTEDELEVPQFDAGRIASSPHLAERPHRRPNALLSQQVSDPQVPHRQGSTRPRETRTRYEIALWPASTTTVRVLDSTQVPLPGITVVWRGSDPQKTASAVTDGRGEVQVPLEDYAQIAIVENDHYARVSALVRAPLTTLELAPPVELSALFLDSAGEPIDGVHVEFQNPGGWRGSWRSVLSDEHGEIVVTGLNPASTWRARLRHRDFAPRDVQVEIPPNAGSGQDPGAAENTLRYTYQLQPTPVLAGVVFDANGVETAARIWCAPASTAFHVRDLVNTDSGDDGAFELRGIGAGDLVLLVEHPDCAPTWIDVEGIEPGESRELTIELETGLELRGQVRFFDNPSGKWIPQDQLQEVPPVSFTVGTVWGDELRGRRVCCDSEGRFIVRGLPRRARHLCQRADIRWRPILPPVTDDDAQNNSDAPALLLELDRPAELLEANGVAVETHGILGSGNTVAVPTECLRGEDDGGVEAMTLLIELPKPFRAPTIELTTAKGDRVRTIVNTIVLSPELPNQAAVIFAGLDGVPRLLRDLSHLDGAWLTFWTREYAMGFAILGAVPGRDGFDADAPSRVALHPRRGLELQLRDRQTGIVLKEQALFLVPNMFSGAGAFAGLYIGETDSDGIWRTAQLPPGRYELYLLDAATTTPLPERAQPWKEARSLDTLDYWGSFTWSSFTLDSAGGTREHESEYIKVSVEGARQR